MNTVLKNSLITGLLFITPQLVNANDFQGPDKAIEEVKNQLATGAQYVLPPTSPYYAANETNKTKVADTVKNNELETSELSNVIRELKIELNNNKKQTTSLFEQLHATATAADFENEKYSKKVVHLQKEIENLKQESLDNDSLKSAYESRNKELVALNKKLISIQEKADAQVKALASSDLEVKKLREAHAVKIKEAEDLNAKLVSYEQIQEELTDLQKDSVELTEDNSLLKSKLTELNGLTIALNTQINKMKLDSEQQSTKLELLDGSSEKLNVLKKEYEGLKLEVSALKGKLLETEGANKALVSEVGLLTSESANKLGLLSETSEELSSLKMIYSERNEEASNLKEELLETEDSKESLFAEIEELKVRSNEALDKVTLFEKNSIELNAIKITYQEKNDEAVLLKGQLTKAEEDNESLVAQTVSLQAALDQNLEKLKLFEQSSAELEALNVSFKEQNDELENFKKLLLDAEGDKKSLVVRIGALESESKQKLAFFDQTTQELNSLKGMFHKSNDEALLLNEEKGQLEEANQILISRLDGLNKKLNLNAEKLGLLDQTSSDLSALKDAYKERDDEVTLLKEQKVQLEEANEILSSRIDGFNKDIALNTEKLTLLEQTSSDLNALKEESGLIVEQKTQLEEANKILISRIDGLNEDAALNAEKLVLLDQTSSDLNALKEESGLIVEQKTQLEEANKILTSKVDGLNAEVEANLQKMTEFEQTSSELTELKSEVTLLKDEKMQLEKANQVLSSKIDTFSKEAEENTKKLKLLAQTSSDLESFRMIYEERDSEAILLAKQKTELEEANTILASRIDKYNQESGAVENLKNELVSLTGTNKSLSSQLESMKLEAGENTKKLGLLSESTAALDALKLSFKERNDENVLLKEKLFELDKTKTTLTEELDKLKNDNLLSTQKLTDASNINAELESANQALDSTKEALAKSTTELDALNKKLTESEALRETLNSEVSAVEAEKLALNQQFTEALKDGDKDGVINTLDECPSTSPDQLVNNVGCIEIADRDGDKVADADDLCPSTSPNTSVNSFGCDVDQNITLEGVNFTSGSDTLTSGSLSIINSAAATLNRNTDVRIEVAGHTDSLGDNTINQQLSLRRANSVAAQLIAQGVSESRITTKGYGDSEPLTTNETQAGRTTNRRVELRLR